MQLLSNNCGGTFTSYYCGTTSINANYLNPGTTYFIRVFSTSAIPPASFANSNFDICIVDPVTTALPANDECAAAVNLSVGSNCANVMGNMAIATPSSEPLGGTCAGPNAYDLRYKFKATGPNENITLSTIGANFLAPQIELLYNAAFPTFLADSAQHRVQYRIRVATSPSNLYSGCAFFNSTRIIVMVNNCSTVLKADLLSFKASLVSKQAHLKWETANETAQTIFEVQKSLDGNRFVTIGTVNAVENRHSYSFADPELLNGFAYYRIIVKEPGAQKISNRELLKTSDASFGFISVVNPFYDILSFELNIPQKTIATIVISDSHGKTVRSFKQTLVKGVNEVTVNNLGSLAGGTYVLQVISGDGVKSRKLVKLSK